MKILCAAKQILGKREKQEDTIKYLSLSTTNENENENENEMLLLLADGMGGHVGGEKASRLIVDKFIESYQQMLYKQETQALREGLDYANNSIKMVISKQSELIGMGATLLVAKVNNKQLHWLSVGDSPFWLFRNGKLIRLNEDHSMAGVYARMVELGQMSQQDAYNEPLRNSLRSVVSGSEISLIDAPKKPFELLENDVLLLASDGLETLTNIQIRDILQQYKSYNMEALAAELLAAVDAENNNMQDNASVIIYKVATLLNIAEKKYLTSSFWMSKNLNLLIILTFSLSSLLIFLFLQFNSSSQQIPVALTSEPLNITNDALNSEFDVRTLLKQPRTDLNLDSNNDSQKPENNTEKSKPIIKTPEIYYQ